MSKKHTLNFWLDVVIAVAFSLTALLGLLLWLVLPGGQGAGNLAFLFFSRRMWIDLHSWAGVVLFAGSLLHIVWHWDWITCVVRRFFSKTVWSARANLGLDSLLFLAFLAASVSGLVPWLTLPGGGFRGGRNPLYGMTALGLTRNAWNDWHLWTGLAMMATILIHLALHWKWIVCVVHNYARPLLVGQRKAGSTRKTGQDCLNPLEHADGGKMCNSQVEL